MQWRVLESSSDVAEAAARRLLRALVEQPAAVLGLPTGRTPIEMYRHVVAACRRGRHCFAAATTFNLDEYVGVAADHPGSYRAYMQRHLFAHVDVDPARVHVPDGMAALVRARQPELSFESALEAECRRYEDEIAAAGGLSLAFLGLGRNGHIAFNEPGSPFDSRTRVVALDESTRQANAPEFPGEAVPGRAITMGIATLLAARSIVLLATGAGKREAVARLRSGQLDEAFPASALHRHPRVTVLLDRDAAGLPLGHAPGLASRVQASRDRPRR